MIPIGTRSLVGRYGSRCRCKCDLSFSGAAELKGPSGRAACRWWYTRRAIRITARNLDQTLA